MKTNRLFLTPLALIIALQLGVSIAYGQKGTQNVKVVNTDSEPVPVAGAVTVGNAADGPLSVRSTDNPALQPFQIKFTELPLRFTVPVGKRLVIEYVSMKMFMNTGCQLTHLETETQVGSSSASFVAPASNIASPSINIGLVHHQVRLYADPETEVAMGSGAIGSDCGLTLGHASISGHLVNVP